MAKPTDIRPVAVELYFLPIKARMPLKFGPEVTTEVTCARVRMTVEDCPRPTRRGLGRDAALGAVGLAQPLGYEERHQALRSLCIRIAEAWASRPLRRRPSDGGRPPASSKTSCPSSRSDSTPANAPAAEPVPLLGALVASSPFDLALHDAFGVLHGCRRSTPTTIDT